MWGGIESCLCVCVCVVSRLLYAFLFDFLFGRHFAISIDCCYYLAHLWYCNGFHCQGQITATQCSYLFEAFIIYISFVWLWLLLLWSSFDVCKLVTTVSIRFIRYKYETNMKWHRSTSRVSINFFLFYIDFVLKPFFLLLSRALYIQFSKHRCQHNIKIASATEQKVWHAMSFC